MRKRILAMALSICMAVVVCGCGNKKEADETQTGKTDVTVTGEDTVPSGDMAEEDYEMQVDGIMQESAANMATADCESGFYDDYLQCPDTEDWNTNEYSYTEENPWMNVQTSPLSTFAADVDTASYTQIRSAIENGYDIDPSMVRIEEMLNYFHYDYPLPKGNEKFAVYTEYADCPWNKDTKLALVAMNTQAIDFKEAPASNLVFLIDVSGSMFDDNKLPLVQQSLTMLAENLTEKDRVSIVTYAGSDEVVLQGVSGDNYHEISAAIEGLEAYGSTNGSAGIETAYNLAQKYFIKGGNNRVILCTDGDLNVGLTSEGQLEKLITEKKESGVFLSTFGVGYGNYKDNKLELLADKGNGNYAYIDSMFEAKKALVDELGANMVTVAKDVKLQVEFNPEQVKGYRLIGYENRVMAAEDFADDTKDGGEMGAGHSVTALYEIIPADSEMELPETDLKYGETAQVLICGTEDYTDELFTVNIRYKEPDGEESKLESYPCKTESYNKDGSDNLRFAASVAAFGMLLKDSEYSGSADLGMVYTLASYAAGSDEYKKEYLSLVRNYGEKQPGFSEDIVE